MKKVVFQGIITVLVFLASWFILKQVDWMNILKIEHRKQNLEEKLGEMFVKYFDSDSREHLDEFTTESIDSILTTITKKNHLDRDKIHLHILENSDVNAFALPDGHMIIYDGLIKAADSQEELTGVICHELAHIELDHVMKKLVKEVGLNILISMTTNGGQNMTQEAARVLSSSAYDRTLESAADQKAVDYMIAAEVNPEPFAGFLYRIREKEDILSQKLSWISTHPESEERAKNIIDYCKKEETKNTRILSDSTWIKVKKRLSEEQNLSEN